MSLLDIMEHSASELQWHLSVSQRGSALTPANQEPRLLAASLFSDLQ